MTRNRNRPLHGLLPWGLLAAILAVSTPAQAYQAKPVQPKPVGIQPGSDLWTTPADGGTSADFSADPIPAGFFCPGSAPFTGTLSLHGVPLVTSPAGVLADTDTIVERLGSVPAGGGSVGVQVRALQLRSGNLIEVFCPDDGETTYWEATACLNGPQVVGEMEIYSEGGDGGIFYAYLPIDVVLSFSQVASGTSFFDPTVEEDPDEEPVDAEPVGRSRAAWGPRGAAEAAKSAPLNLPQTLTLSASGASWTTQPVAGSVTHSGSLLVDADCDGVAETSVPGTSNFAGGWNSAGGSCGSPPCRAPTQHQAPQHQHVVMPPLSSTCDCI